MTILIIDDSEDDILLTQMVIRKMNRDIRVESALSGRQGIEMLRYRPDLPSLVLLDLKMPGMDGLDVLRIMRADDRLAAVPVVMVTHSDLESDRAAASTAGASSFLKKSIDLDRFTEELRKELAKWLGDWNKD